MNPRIWILLLLLLNVARAIASFAGSLSQPAGGRQYDGLFGLARQAVLRLLGLRGCRGEERADHDDERKDELGHEVLLGAKGSADCDINAASAWPPR